MAARDLHAKYPKILAGYMGIAKQRHGIDSAASQNCILRDHDSKLFILSYGQDKSNLVLAGYMVIAKQRHGIDSAASQNCILRNHDSKLFILSYG
nr:hypothetical protein Iba_chr13aCG11080 [Ipomoea batatas]